MHNLCAVGQNNFGSDSVWSTDAQTNFVFCPLPAHKEFSERGNVGRFGEGESAEEGRLHQHMPVIGAGWVIPQTGHGGDEPVLDVAVHVMVVGINTCARAAEKLRQRRLAKADQRAVGGKLFARDHGPRKFAFAEIAEYMKEHPCAEDTRVKAIAVFVNLLQQVRRSRCGFVCLPQSADI